ncbi:MAG: hypothetical protein N2578_00445 [Bdellovibrionaceae bacterium]|nr:hypothetical protein [Pseudobdellovibrionaceae bacterium]
MAVQNLYSGASRTSLGETGSGYGLEFVVLADGEYLVPYGKARANLVSGRQGFLDGSTPITSNFIFYDGQGELGLAFYPIKRRKGEVNIYLSAAGVLSYSYLSLERTLIVTNIPLSDQTFGGGYSTSLAGEWIFGMGVSKWSIAAEITYRQISATLLKTKFDLSNISLGIGLGW